MIGGSLLFTEGASDHTPKFMLKLTLAEAYARKANPLIGVRLAGWGYEPVDTSLNWGLEIEFNHGGHDFNR